MIPLLQEILVQVMLLVGAGAITFLPFWLSARVAASGSSSARRGSSAATRGGVAERAVAGMHHPS